MKINKLIIKVQIFESSDSDSQNLGLIYDVIHLLQNLNQRNVYFPFTIIVFYRIIWMLLN